MKGKSIALILGGGKAAKGEGAEEEDSYEEAFADAASECMEAIESGNSERFADALKDCIHICLEHGNSPGEEGEEY